MLSGYWSQDTFFRPSLTLSEVKQLAFQIQLMIKRAQTVALGKAGPKPDAGASSSRIRQVKAVREPARPPEPAASVHNRMAKSRQLISRV